jgi:transcription antitermination factor NusG
MSAIQAIVTPSWYAVKVRTRSEVKIGEALRHRNLEIFLPTYAESRQYSDRIKRRDAPLFPGYLFCRIDLNKRQPILTTPGVDHIVGFGGIAVPVPDSEIAGIQRVMNTRKGAIPWPYLTVGQKIRIECGALSGIEGLVVRAGETDRLILSVHILQRSVSVEIDRSWIRPLTLQPLKIA